MRQSANIRVARAAFAGADILTRIALDIPFTDDERRLAADRLMEVAVRHYLRASTSSQLKYLDCLDEIQINVVRVFLELMAEEELAA
jgi:hypothetical protein